MEKTPWYKFEKDPLARIVLGVILLVIAISGGQLSLSSAEAAGGSIWSVLLLVLGIWLIVRGVKLYRS